MGYKQRYCPVYPLGGQCVPVALLATLWLQQGASPRCLRVISCAESRLSRPVVQVRSCLHQSASKPTARLTRHSTHIDLHNKRFTINLTTGSSALLIVLIAQIYLAKSKTSTQILQPASPLVPLSRCAKCEDILDDTLIQDHAS